MITGWIPSENDPPYSNFKKLQKDENQGSPTNFKFYRKCFLVSKQSQETKKTIDIAAMLVS